MTTNGDLSLLGKIVTDEYGNTVVTIQSPKRRVDKIIYYIFSAFLAIISIYFFRNGIFMLSAVFSDPSREASLFVFVFSLFYIGMATYCAVSIIYSYKWVFKGVEKISFEGEEMIRELSPAPLINRKRSFFYESIIDLKYRSGAPFPLIPPSYVFGNIQGNVWFRYEGFRSSVGVGLSDEFSLYIINLIMERKSSIINADEQE